LTKLLYRRNQQIGFYLYNKRACPTKNEPQQGISYLERERAGEREREGLAGWQAGQQAGIFKVMLGLGVIEGRGRNTEIQGDREK
jgi:hypothetical protein